MDQVVGVLLFALHRRQVTPRGVQSATFIYTSSQALRYSVILVKVWFGTELEGLDPVPLQTVFLPYSVHRGPGTNPLSGSPARASVCGALGRAQRRGHHCLFLGRADPARAATVRLGAQHRNAASRNTLLTAMEARILASALLAEAGPMEQVEDGAEASKTKSRLIN